jgi:signal transduction histidine kinase
MTALFLLSPLLGVLIAAMLLRAGRQRENRMSALAALLDAGRDLGLGLLLARGLAIDDPLTLQVCVLGRTLVAYPSLEFAYAFPSGRRPPLVARTVAFTAMVICALISLHPKGSLWVQHPLVMSAYFLPFVFGIMRGLSLNLKHSYSAEAAQGVRMVLVVLLARFAVELFTHIVVGNLWPELFPTAISCTAVLGMLAYVLIAYAVLRYRLFNVRRVAAEGALFGTLAVSCLAFVVGGAELVITHAQQPIARGVLFAALGMLPLGAWLLAERYAPSFAEILLSPFDARQRLLKTVLERVLHVSVKMVEPAALRELTRSAIAELCRGTAVLWTLEVPDEDEADPGRTSTPRLPELLAKYLDDSGASVLHQLALEELTPEQVAAFSRLGADALVAVRAQNELLCAFAIQGKGLDQDMLHTAKALADNLGAKLAHHALYERAFELSNQLEASRRLATLGSFAAAIAHDIRTPLTSVKMNLEMIQRSPRLDQDGRECADMALEELGRMNDYVSGILDYVRPVRLRAVDIDIHDLVQETTRTVQPLFQSRKLALQYDVANAQLLPKVRVDASRMRQVLLNLLKNAADASDPGRTISIAASPEGAHRVAIRVSDQGHGIDQRNLERIFEPFFTTRREGTGLGLAIVKKVVGAHDGELRVDSVIGAGSTFTVLLPA